MDRCSFGRLRRLSCRDSWKLKRSDQTVGKNQDEICLRDIEKQLSRDKQDGIDTYTAKRMNLNSLFDDYIINRPLKASTRTNYKYMYNKYIRETLGVRNIADIHYSDILRFYRSLIIEIGFKPQSMEVIHTILHPIFSLAVRDGYIRVNPTDGIMREIRAQYNWETERRRALTEEQQSAFVSYVSGSVQYCHWMPLFTVLLGTGGRIAEILGLRWQDCDFGSGIITIDHTLIYRLQENGKCEYHITTPKTKAGVREIPMFDEVRRALLQEKARQQKEGENNTIIHIMEANHQKV